jgi:uncharacterized membrane protein YhaH (DUF805 family)
LFWPYTFTLCCAMNIAGYYWMMFRIGRLMHLARPPGESGSGSLGPGPIVVHAPSVLSTPIPEFQTIIFGLAIGVATFFALVAAAVWRRLHDRGYSGLWGLLPVGFCVISLMGMLRLMSDPPEGGTFPGFFLIMFLSNLAYFASGVALVIMLARAGTPGPNEFGPDPAATGGE